MGEVEHILSVYAPPPGFRALGLPTHDNACALWRRTDERIELVRYWEFERVSGLKHHGVPIYRAEDLTGWLDRLLGEEGLRLADMAEVHGTHGGGTGDSVSAAGLDCGLPLHSLAHLFSAIGLDTEIFRTETIVALAPDGAPFFADDSTTRNNWYAGCVSRAGQVSYYPIESPGQIFERAKREFRREEGTLMALASATSCVVALDPAALLGADEYWGGAQLGPQASRLVTRIHRAVLDELATGAGRDRCHSDPRFTAEENAISATMKVVQAISIAIVERSLNSLLDRDGIDPTESYLGLAGGYALNCPTNSHLMDTYGFKGLLAPPCANDGGQALGIGLMRFEASGDLRRRSFRFGSAYHGRGPDLDAGLAEHRAAIRSVGDLDPDQFVDDVIRHPVAYIDGRAEIGPRALGHRSILADPRSLDTKARLNEVKQREWWRPVAPLVLEEYLPDWFEQARRSPYMLEVFQLREQVAGQVPVIAHLDRSARVQTLAATDDARLYELLTAFRRRTGVPMLGNTSLNDKGEPIVDRAAEGINFCLRKGLPVAYIDGRRVELDLDSPAARRLDAPDRRASEFFAQAKVRTDVWRSWEELGLRMEMLVVYAHSPFIRRQVRLDTAVGRRKLGQLTRLVLAADPAEAARVHRLAAELTNRFTNNQDLPPHSYGLESYILDPS